MSFVFGLIGWTIVVVMFITGHTFQQYETIKILIGYPAMILGCILFMGAGHAMNDSASNASGYGNVGIVVLILLQIIPILGQVMLIYATGEWISGRLGYSDGRV